MMPHRIPIHLADGSVLHSEGVGSVQFIPVVNGQEMAPVEFTNVLYVKGVSDLRMQTMGHFSQKRLGAMDYLSM